MIFSMACRQCALHGGLSNAVIWENTPQLHTTVLVLKDSYGLI